jgi:hypothetical protein
MESASGGVTRETPPPLAHGNDNNGNDMQKTDAIELQLPGSEPPAARN